MTIFVGGAAAPRGSSMASWGIAGRHFSTVRAGLARVRTKGFRRIKTFSTTSTAAWLGGR